MSSGDKAKSLKRRLIDNSFFLGNLKTLSGKPLVEASGRCSQEWSCVSSSAAFQVAVHGIRLKGILFIDVMLACLCSVTATEQDIQSWLGAREGSAPTKLQPLCLVHSLWLVIFGWFSWHFHRQACWKDLSACCYQQAVAQCVKGSSLNDSVCIHHILKPL